MFLYNSPGLQLSLEFYLDHLFSSHSFSVNHIMYFFSGLNTLLLYIPRDLRKMGQRDFLGMNKNFNFLNFRNFQHIRDSFRHNF